MDWEEPAYLPVNIMGDEYYRCPMRPALDDGEFYERVVAAYVNYRNGFLPEVGGVQDQSAVMMRLLGVCDQMAHQIEKYRMDLAAKRARQQ